MVDQIINNEILNNNTVKQQQELLGIEKKSTQKNPYQNVSEFTDQYDLSDEALKLYERAMELEKYRKMVLESIDDDKSIGEIVELINTGKYLNDDELAESLLGNKDFTDMLISE